MFGGVNKVDNMKYLVGWIIEQMWIRVTGSLKLEKTMGSSSPTSWTWCAL